MVKYSSHLSLRLTSFSVVTIWIIAQIILMFCHFGPQQGDWGTYIALAHRCYAAGGWYPMQDDLYSKYIFAPGLVNMLIAEARLFGSIAINKWLYLLMNIGVLANIYMLARHLFSQRVGYMAAIIYCALYVNWFIALSANTELPFLFLSLSAVSLCVTGGGHTWRYIVVGVLLGLANWIRPLAVIFVLGILAYYVMARKWNNNLYLTGAALTVTVLVIGLSAKRSLGRFCCQSTTSGFNLIMTANDKAFGGVDTQIWQDPTSTAYIVNENKRTCFERDSIRMARATAWIKVHPVRYVWLYFKKMPVLMAEDSWSDQRIYGSEPFMYKYQHGMYTTTEFVKRLSLKLLRSVPYYLMLMLAGFSLWRNRRDVLTMKGWILSFFVIGILLTCLYPVQPRYHYPFLFPLMIWTAYGADRLISDYQSKKINHRCYI